MFKPKSLRENEKQMTPEQNALLEKARKTLMDKSIPDEDANKIITECNSILIAGGMMPANGVCMRDKFNDRWAV